MIYQVRANLFFTDHDEAVDFYHDCELAFAKSIIVNPDSENAEFAVIELIQNNHDQDPNQPCDLEVMATNEPS